MRYKSPRRLLAAVISSIMTVSLALAGCAAGVPTTGEVVYHPVPTIWQQADIGAAPVAPAPGASAATIVEGFLHAMGNYQPNYLVARQYLTRIANQGWNPNSGVQIYADGHLPRSTKESVFLSAPLVGKVDASGNFTHVTRTDFSHDFGLVKDETGQWRISNPPEGLLVSQYLFTNGWINVNLHYIPSTGGSLVPEPVVVARGDDLLDRVIRRQLEQPSKWLAPVVLPSLMAQLGEATVSQDPVTLDVIANISLVSLGKVQSYSDRENLLAQLAYTVIGLGIADQIRVTADGAVWVPTGKIGEVVSRSDFWGISPTMSTSELYGANADGISLAGLSPRLIASISNVDSFAVSQSLRQVAVAKSKENPEVNEAKNPPVKPSAKPAKKAKETVISVSSIGSDELTQVRVGKSLLRPEFTSFSELWTASTKGLASLEVYRPEKNIIVNGQNLPKGDLQAFRVSVDGVRLVASITTKSGPKLGVMRISRIENSVEISGWREIPLSEIKSRQYLDVGWSGENEVSVLVSDFDGRTSLERATIDGARISLISQVAVTDLVELACSPGLPTVFRAVGGNVYELESDLSWPQSRSSFDALNYSR